MYLALEAVLTASGPEAAFDDARRCVAWGYAASPGGKGDPTVSAPAGDAI